MKLKRTAGIYLLLSALILTLASACRQTEQIDLLSHKKQLQILPNPSPTAAISSEAASKSSQSNGTLDANFGENGAVKIDGEITGVILQPLTDNNFQIAGFKGNSIFLAKYSADGKPDVGFGKSGFVQFEYSQSAVVSELCFTPANKLLTIAKNAQTFVLKQYSPDGNLDKSFGKNGQISIAFYKSIGIPSFLKDNTFLISGDNKTHNFMISGYLPTGQINSKFGKNGSTAIRFDDPYSFLTAIAVQPDGNFVAAGFETSNDPSGNVSSNQSSIVLARFSKDGTPDNSFGEKGKVSVNLPLTADEISTASSNAALIQPDGKILVGGQINLNFGLVRLLSNGKLDTNFGDKGLVENQIKPEFYQSNITHLMLQPDGKILATGDAISVKDPTETRFFIGRYLSDGKLDETFGKSGFVISDFNVGENGISKLSLQSDNRLLVVGTDKLKHLFIFRYFL